MKILAEDLARLCYNAIQFSSKDSSLGGVVMFSNDTTHLVAFASDDYVAMMDKAKLQADTEGFEIHLALKELKELEKWLRDKEGAIELDLTDEGLIASATPEGVPAGTEEVELHSTLQIVSEPPDFSGVVEVVHSEPNPFTGEYSPSAEPFAIRGERFTKFRLLKTPESPSCKDGYPVDFLWDGQIIRWKCGPFLRGVVGPLARYSYTTDTGIEVTGIKDLYQEESEVLW